MLAANRAISTIFQEVQEFSLQSQWKFADLVEKQAATICELYQTGTFLMGTCIGAFFRAKEFGLNQLLGQCCAVHLDEGAR